MYKATDISNGGYGVLAVLLAGLMLLGLMSLDAQPAHAQSTENAFEVDAFTVKGSADHRTRVDLYARVPYSSVRFLSSGDEYTARYTISAEVHRLSDSDDPQYVAARERWDRSVTAQNYATTRSSQEVDRSSRSIELRPGSYMVVYQLEDEATDRVHEKTMTVNVRDFAQTPALSSIMLVDDYDAVSQSITPRASREVGTNERRINFFYEVYADEDREVRFQRRLIRSEGAGGISVIGSLLGRDRDSAESATTFSQVESQRIQSGRTPVTVTMPLDDVRVGEYTLQVQMLNLQDEVIDEVEKHITVRWQGLTAHIQNLDDAIEQLRYIAKERDLEHIRAGETEAERRERFLAFWEKRDPTPGTQRNQRMEEYYYRVARANRSYTTSTAVADSGQEGEKVDGWETDRGFVLVRFGEPDRVESRPFSAEREPYEVWHYERIDRRFVFVDRGAQGYQLVEPVWNERSRIR